MSANTPEEARPPLMRYATLFSSPTERAALCAAYNLRETLKSAPLGLHKEAVHARLSWWRRELAGVVNGHAHHPSTRALLRAHPEAAAHASRWTDILEVAASETPDTPEAFNEYADHDWGHLLRTAADILNIAPPESWLSQLGRALASAEALQELGLDSARGRIRLPADMLAKEGVQQSSLRAGLCDEACMRLFSGQAHLSRTQLQAVLDTTPRSYGRHLLPLITLAALFRHVLEPVTRQGALPLQTIPTILPLRAWTLAVGCRLRG